MPPRDPKPANRRRIPKTKPTTRQRPSQQHAKDQANNTPKPKLDVPEPALNAMLEKYCDLRRRGFTQQAIQTKASRTKHYPAELAVRQCTEILYRLLGYPNNSARDRAYTMLSMAEAGLHSFDYDSGKWVHAELERTGLDEDVKHTVIMNLYPNEDVGQLLLQRCGMSSKWLTGNGARSLSRLIRHYQFSPAFTRNLLERLGNDPDTYYIIGPNYRIPEPSKEGKDQCIQALQEAGFTNDRIENALSTLGVPP